MEPSQGQDSEEEHVVAVSVSIPTLDEAGRREFMRIMQINEMSDVDLDEEGRPILTEILDRPGACSRLGEFLESVTSTKRDRVVDQFWKECKIVQNAMSYEEMVELLLDKDDSDPLVPSPESPVHVVLARPQSLPVEVELCGENRVDIEELHKVVISRNNPHEGKFFLGRTLTPAVNGVWVDVVVEDPSGINAAVLRLSYFTPPKYAKYVGRRNVHDDYLGMLPPGSFIAVKNPIRGPTAGESASCVLQVMSDNPGNVVILTEKKMKELFPDLIWMGSFPGGSFWDTIGRTEAGALDAFKKMGNEAFVFKRYTDAIRCYDMALDYVVEEQDAVGYITIWSNKAAAFLGFNCFMKGLECCDKALSRDPFHVKSIYRKVKALVGLGRYSEAIDFLTDKLDDPSIPVENNDLRNLRTKIPQPGTTPLLEKLMNRSMILDDFTAEYVVGPIEFRPTSISGRGVFATEDIKPGQVILFQRTFAEGEGFEPRGKGDEEMEGKHLLGHHELIGTIANKIAFAPELGSEIYKVWAGEEMQRLDVNDPENRKVNIERIRKIVGLYAKFGSKDGYVATNIQLMNHSCTESNIMTGYSPNWIFNSATKLIKKGEQIYNDWVDPTLPLDDRKERLKKLGMTCNCRRCQLDAEEGPKVQEKTVNLVKQLTNLKLNYESSRPKLNRAMRIVKELEQLRPDNLDISLIIISSRIRTALCSSLLVRFMFKETIALSKKFYVADQVTNHPISAMSFAINALVANLGLKNVAKATEWAKEVRNCAVILYGCPTASDAWGGGQLIDQISAAGVDISQVFGKA